MLGELGRHTEALASFGRAIALKPDDAEAYDNCGLVLADLERHTEALTSFDRAIALKPDFARAWYNRGNTLRELHRHRDAVDSFERAIALEPEYASAHWNLADCHLLLGDFARGWSEYEWRWKLKQREAIKREFAQPLWLGDWAPQGQTMLLHAEMGLGDTLLFCRYAKEVAALGVKLLRARRAVDVHGRRELLARGVGDRRAGEHVVRQPRPRLPERLRARAQRGGPERAPALAALEVVEAAVHGGVARVGDDRAVPERTRADLPRALHDRAAAAGLKRRADALERERLAVQAVELAVGPAGAGRGAEERGHPARRVRSDPAWRRDVPRGAERGARVVRRGRGEDRPAQQAVGLAVQRDAAGQAEVLAADELPGQRCEPDDGALDGFLRADRDLHRELVELELVSPVRRSAPAGEAVQLGGPSVDVAVEAVALVDVAGRPWLGVGQQVPWLDRARAAVRGQAHELAGFQRTEARDAARRVVEVAERVRARPDPYPYKPALAVGAVDRDALVVAVAIDDEHGRGL